MYFLFLFSNIYFTSPDVQFDYIADSLIDFTKNNDIPDGNYNVAVTGEDGTVIVYAIELVNYYDDITYTANTETDEETGEVKEVPTTIELGDDSADYKTLIVKYHKNLTVGENVTLTANRHLTTVGSADYELTYKKGMYIHINGILTNNGEISMTARGTNNYVGENVYLWKNKDNTFEYIPAVGAQGGKNSTQACTGNANSGKNGENRQTGGGGNGSGWNCLGKGGSAGTSYSGGTGAGSGAANSYYGAAGKENGGAGGNGNPTSSTYTGANGGAGNPGGEGSGKAAAKRGSNGTGGLLAIYANNYINNGKITSNGMPGGSSGYGGGSSGGGSINIFINNSFNVSSSLDHFNTQYNLIFNEIGSFNGVESLGGAAVGSSKKGGAGGDGTVNIGKIEDEQYYDIKEAIKNHIESEKRKLFQEVEGKSILQILEENDLQSGYYIFKVNDKDKEYPVHLYNFNGDQIWNENQTFGDEYDSAIDIDEAQHMVVVKVNGNLIINEGVKVTTFGNEYGGPKGFTMYVTGKLTNNGEVSMTARGAKATGENVYLYQKPDKTYEYVPATGGAGGARSGANSNGKIGGSLTPRGTGGGGSGGCGGTAYSPIGGTGTSYSGGAGAGFGTYKSNGTGSIPGSDIGGAGGYSSSTNANAGGGAGNPGGKSAAGQTGSNGTGGLLTIYSDVYENNGSVNADGSKGGGNTYGGGSSGGGSINIFANDIIKKGSATVNGGAVSGSTRKGGAGGDGKVTYFEIPKQPILKELKVNKINAAINQDNLEAEVTLNKYDVRYIVEGTTEYDSEFDSVVVTNPESKRIDPGETKVVDVILTSKFGLITVYKLTITNPEVTEHNSKLYRLDIERYEDEFDPLYYPLTNDYNVSILKNELEVNVIYKKYDPEATVEIEGNKLMFNKTGTITVTVHEPHVEDTVYTINYNRLTNTVYEKNFDYTGNYQTFTAPWTTKYRLEVYGAEGGETVLGSNNGGYGGYSYGDVTLEKGDKLYVYVGGSGNTGGPAGGWNGGGSRPLYNGGGGATDIRLVPGKWNDKESLLSRIIVAGGGGSQGGTTGSYTVGGFGGGLEGTAAKVSYFIGTGGEAGIQESAGTGGGFGFGGSGIDANEGHGGAGGGGWYGGGGVTPDETEDDETGGGGGSGFILTEETALTTPEGYNVPSKYYLTDADTFSGNYNVGNGKAKITTELLSLNNYLNELRISNAETNEIYTLNPEFDTEKTEYNLSLNVSETYINIEASAIDSTAEVQGTGKFRVSSGTTVYPISVTSENGNIRVYNVNVTRPISDISDAKNIVLTGLVENICARGEQYCALDKAFKSDEYEYEMTVPAGIMEIEFTVLKNHYFQTVVGDGIKKLDPWSNNFEINVTSEDKNHTSTYKFKIIRDMTGDNYLSKINVINPSIDIGFHYLNTEYEFKVNNEIEEIELEIKTDDSNASYRVIGQGNLSVGEIANNTVTVGNLEVGNNVVEVEVTAANGEVRSYILNVYRVRNSNVLLNTIKIRGNSTDKYYDLTPEFKDIRTSYTVEVENEDTSYALTAIAEETTAKISLALTSYSGNYGYSVNEAGWFALKVGANEEKIIVTAEDGSIETYKILITRKKNSNNYLGSMYLNVCYDGDKNRCGNNYGFNESINYRERDNYTLTIRDPHFLSGNVVASPEVNTSKVNVDMPKKFKIGENKITVTVTAENGDKKNYYITVTKPGSDENRMNYINIKKADETVLKSISSSEENSELNVTNDVDTVVLQGQVLDTLSTVKGLGTYKLKPGKNTIKITVTSETGISKIYTINVFREYNDDYYLKKITLSTGTLNPEFDKETFEYTVNVGSNVGSIKVTGTPNVKTSTVIGNKTYDLVTGENTITLTVTSQKNTTKDYVIKVVRDESDNNNLSFLALKEGKINPEFDKMKIDYTAKVPYEIENVNVIAVPEEESNDVVINSPTLTVGENEVTAIVTSESGKVKVYTITVTRQEETDDDLTLKTLDVTSAEINYQKEELFYEAEVDYSVNEVIVTAEAEDSTATVEGLGTHSLNVGPNMINVVVSKNNYERSYQVLITRKENPEARLSNIIVKNGTMNNNISTTYVYTGNVQEFVAPEDGTYRLETWGAQGGYSSDSNKGGKGGYSKGEIELKEGDILYVYIGGSGNTGGTSGGWNGGGLRQGSYTRYGGGGATDIRLVSGEWYNNESLLSRFIVAGGGGSDGAASRAGGAGGGLEGESATDGYGTGGQGGTQTSGYTFGQAGTGKSQNNGYGGAGGGGWYGGQGTTPDSSGDDDKGGGGGSGFILTEKTATTVPEGYSVTSKYYLNNASTKTGVNVGNGRAKITLLKNDEVKFEKDKEDYIVETEDTSLDLELVKLYDKQTIESIEGNSNFENGVEKLVTITVRSADKLNTKEYRLHVTKTESTNTYLESLEVEEHKISPGFSKGIYEYKVTVPNSENSVIINAEAEHPSSIVSGDGMHSIDVGENEIIVTVTSESGEERDYKIIVNRKGSSNYYLNSLSVTGHSFNEEFERGRQTYSMTLPYDVKEVEVNATAEDENAIISPEVPFTHVFTKKGLNVIPIIVTAENGQIRTYKIRVTREAPISSLLEKLEVKNYELVDEFDSETLDYSVTVDNEVENLLEPDNLIIKTLDPNATYVVSGNTGLAVGLNTIEILVTSSNGVDTSTYTISVNRQAYSNTYLSNLSVTKGSNLYPLSPEFEKGTLSYEVIVPNEITSVNINAAPQGDCTISGTGKVSNLKVGDNKKKVIVKSKTGITRTYNINIKREATFNLTIESEIGSLTKTDETTYKLEVDKNVERILDENIIVTPEDPTSIITKTGDLELKKESENIYTVTMTSADGSKTKEYLIYVEYEVDDSAFIRILNPNTGELEPSFNPRDKEYTLNIFDDENEVEFYVKLMSEYATLLNDDLVFKVEGQSRIVEFIVQAEDGHIETYTVTIRKSKTREKYAKDIKVTGYENACEDCKVSPDFNETEYNYTLTVPYEVGEVNFEVTKKDTRQTVRILRDETVMTNYTLKTGINNYKVEIINSLNEIVTYSYKIERLKSSNNYLKSLKLLSPSYEFADFEKEKEEYSVRVENEYNKIEIEAIPEVAENQVEIKGAGSLIDGNNDVKIRVRAGTGEIREYIIHVLKEPEENNLLKTLTVSSGNIYTLNPSFNPGQQNYTLKVPTEVDKIMVEGVAEDEDKVRVDGNGEYNLKIGLNKIIISAVMKETGTKRDYTILITRSTDKNTYLSYLEVLNGVMSPEYAKETIKYDVTVEPEVEKLNLRYAPEVEGSTVEVIGNEKLVTGENEVRIKVRSKDKLAVRTYLLKVIKKPKTNNNLLKILIDDEELQDFSKDKLEYSYTNLNSLRFDYDKLSIKIEGIKEDLSSKVEISEEGKTEKVEGIGVYSLKLGENIFNITVTAEDGTSQIYKLTVYREYNTYLRVLDIDKGELKPVFNRKTLTYDLEIEDKELTIFAETEDTENALVEGSNTYLRAYEVPAEGLQIPLVVTNHGDARTYTINVTRKLKDNVFLKYLTVGEGTLTPEFNKETEDYEVTIPYDKDALSLDYAPEEESSNAVDTGNNTLTEGSIVRITVTAENGSTKEYRITVHKEKEEEYSNKLSSLTLTLGTNVTPEEFEEGAFNKEKNLYHVTVKNDVKSVKIEAESEDSEAEIDGVGTFPLKEDRKEFKVVVTSQDGVKRTYTIVVTKEKSNDARLSLVEFKNATLTNKFDKDTEEYTMLVDHDENLIKLNRVIPKLKETTWEWSYDTDLSKIEEGNKIKIIATAPDKQSTKTYTFIIKLKKSGNAYLKELIPSVGELKQLGDPSKPFEKTWNFYQIDLDTSINVSNITFRATPESKYAITNNKAEGYNLTNQTTTIEITVTAENTAPNTYVIIVNRKLSNNAYLKELQVVGYEINPEFDKTVYGLYTLEVENEVESVTIKAIKEDSRASVIETRVEDLKVGKNNISIIVTAENGETKEYKLEITRKPLLSNRIKELEIDEGILDPEFNSDLHEYTVKIPNEYEQITEHVKLEEETATYKVLYNGSENKVLNVGLNEVTIEVTSSDANLEKGIYTLYVIRQQPSNNYLSRLDVNPGSLTPAFQKQGEPVYRVIVSKNVENITVYAIPELSTTKVYGIYKGNEEEILNGEAVYSLEKGENLIVIKSVSSTGVERTHKIYVTREVSNNNNLRRLEVNGNEIVLENEKTTYEVTLDSEENIANIVAEAEDENASVSPEDGRFNRTINSGTTTVLITVTAENGDAKLYTITFNRTASSNKNILNIIPSVGELEPEFDNNGDDNYTVNVPAETNIISFDVQTESALTKVRGHENIPLINRTTLVTINVEAEDKGTREIKITVIKGEKLTNLNITDDKITVLEGEEEELSIITTPEGIEADLEYNFDDITVADYINEKIRGLKKGSTLLTVSSKENPEIKDIVIVKVISKEIESEVYKIEEATKDGKGEVESPVKVIYGFTPGVTIDEFIRNINNEEEYLKVYTEDGTQVEDMEEKVKTGLILKLEIKGKIYDEVNLVLIGDTNKDGSVDTADINGIKTNLLKDDFDVLSYFAGDINHDGLADTADINKVKNYLLHDTFE